MSTSKTSLPDRTTYRVRPFPAGYKLQDVNLFIQEALNVGTDDFKIHSLSLDLAEVGGPREQVATVTFRIRPSALITQTKRHEWEFSNPSYISFDTRFHGLTPLTPTANEAACTIDCIFLHGWGAHAMGSWMAEDSTYAWLRDDIPPRFPSLRVWTYGYGSRLDDPNFISDYYEDAERFIRSLRSLRDDAKQPLRPIIFIVHSLGGLVFKEAMISMSTSKHNRDQENLRLTSGALFFGVPNQGLDATDLASMVDDLSSQLTLTHLDQDASFRLREKQDEQFSSIWSDRKFRIIQFFEQVKTPTVVKRSDGSGYERSGKSSLFVKPISATSSRIGGDNKIAIYKDHRNMVKFSRNDKEDYGAVCQSLKQLVVDTPNIIEPRKQNQSKSTYGEPDIFLDRQVQKRLFQIPSIPNKGFIGREKKLEELEQKVIINAKASRFAIVGLGGVGKTRLTLAFCYLVKAKYPDYSIFWISAVSSERFMQDYIQLAKRCSLPIDANEDQVVPLLQAYLSSEAGKWLMIVDNADERTIAFEDDGGIVPKLAHSETGTILFTTRSKEMAFDLAGGNIIKLEEMNPDEAQLFLASTLTDENFIQDEGSATRLLEELAYLPLAIVQASSYIIKKSITIRQYLTLIESTAVKLLSLDFRDPTRDHQGRNAVALTWLLSFEQIKRDQPEAIDILFFLALLENKNIPLSILPTDESDDSMMDLIGTLIGYSFLTKHAAKDEYDMHRLVHRAVKIWMQNQGIMDIWSKKVIYHLEETFPTDDWENRDLWQEYIPHAIKVLQNTKQMDLVQRADLCLQLGRCLNKDGRAPEAIQWISECVSWRDGSLPEDDEARLCAQHVLAVAYIESGQEKDAIDLLEKVTAIEARKYAEDDPERLMSLHELARAYTGNKEPEKAIDILEDVIVQRRELAEDDPDRLASQHVLARAYLSIGEITKATEILEEIVSIESRSLAEDHPDRLASQHVLAKAHLLKYESTAATQILENIVSTESKLLADDHPDRLASQGLLAEAYIDLERFDEAISLMQHVVDVQSESLRVDHPDRIHSKARLAEMLDMASSKETL